VSEATRVVVAPNEAIGMLPTGEKIHTFRGAGPILVGADWKRVHVEELLGRLPAELSGPMATGMHHGLCVKDEHGWLFIETRSPDASSST